ncbi:hypothetical protein GCM10010411_79130 [Actinomadura fulvescens]|uniref:Uncharacterized protein n=1 Tax=Actinomadura fulvescens TaxID=46160 RepID=A0ABP6CZ15_9ACTN
MYTVPGIRRASALGDERFRVSDIGRTRTQVKHISRCPGHDRTRHTQQAPQAGHVALQGVRRRRRWLAVPDGVDQPVDADHLARPQSQDGQHRLAPKSRNVPNVAVHGEIHRTKQPHLNRHPKPPSKHWKATLSEPTRRPTLIAAGQNETNRPMRIPSRSRPQAVTTDGGGGLWRKYGKVNAGCG